MQPSPLRLCIGALAYTAGLVRGLGALLLPLNSSSSAIGNAVKLRRTFVGHSRSHVARLLGPPRACSLTAAPSSATFWIANVWYYPFDPQNQTAIAVQFNRDRVIGVEFIGA